MISLGTSSKVYLAIGSTDMRKGINTLSLMVSDNLFLDPFSGHLFAFCNRRRNRVKILFWDRNGFWLFQKQLEEHLFRWPQSGEEVKELSSRELGWLLEGLDPIKIRGHSELQYSTLA